ncbi:MAG TPA: Gfo/Idh/MocA family oxidoreductase [Tepidisphaeraceae bacterium]|nr:Gfo/Idh/MocA family oxidoreductase [Tepidisphaeraceae bacterium]
MNPATEQSHQTPLPVAVVGCGRMGRLHARAYSQLAKAKLMGVFDISPDAASTAAEEYECGVFESIDSMLDKVKAVTIAVPTNAHLELAEPFLKRGIACLIEKPLAANVAQSKRIIELAKESGAVIQVGHIERFNPAFTAMQRLNIQPRFIEVTRISPLTFRSIDVGVVLDMMIHDIDIVLQLANSKVSRIDAVGVSVIGQVEDICNARVTFENGCVANITASRLALKTERRIRVFSADAYVSVDYQKRYGIVARRGENISAIRDTVARIRKGEITDLSQLNFMDLVQVDELAIDETDPLRAELESFIGAATGKCSPAVTADQGLAAVELATQIVESIAHQILE